MTAENQSVAEVIGIVGAGTMGTGIAQLAVQSGLRVLLFDSAPGAAERARTALAERLDRLVARGDLPADPERLERLTLAGRLDELAGASVVVEAVVEDLEAKRALFAKLESVLADRAILASNTSSLSIAALARDTRRPGRIAGLHFFNPVPVMKLVEIVAAPQTERPVIERLIALGRALGRTPVEVRDGPGFLVNFGNRAFLTEALHLLQERVAEPAEIDAIMRDCCGFRMGPFELMDLTGIDLNYPATRAMYAGYQDEPRVRTTAQHEGMFRAGRFGRKSGQGFYRYDAAGKPVAAPVPPARPESPVPRRLVCPEAVPSLVALLEPSGVELHVRDDGESPIVLALLGEDCTTACHRLGLPARRTVAVDTAFETGRRVTIMTAPGADPASRDGVAALLSGQGRAVSVIRDSPGFVAQRLVAGIANLGCDMAQQGIASPADIDLALRLGLNYPMGPLEWADAWGLERVHATLAALQAITGSDRYRPSLWLRRRTLLGLGAHTPD